MGARVRVAAYAVWVVGCAVVGGVVGGFRTLQPLCEQRGCSVTLHLREALLHLDGSLSVIGAVLGLVSLVVAEWVRRGR